MRSNDFSTIGSLALLVLGCAGLASAQDSGWQARQIMSNGIERHYQLFEPPPRDSTTRPLVLLLHGNGGSAAQLVGATGNPAPFGEWLRLAKRHGWVVAAPDGSLPEPGGSRGWNDCRADTDNNPATDDVAFLGALIDELALRSRADARRVFLLGHSNGGHMALRMAIEQPQRVRAVAAVAAAMPAASECSRAATAVPIMIVNGTADSVMPFEGGRVGFGRVGRGTVLSTPATVDFWVRLNGARPDPLVRRLPDRDRRDGSTVIRHTYRASGGAPMVVFYRVEGGGHTIPTLRDGRRGLLQSRTNHDFETANAAYEFFAAQLR